MHRLDTTKKKAIFSGGLLFLAAALWGSGFVITPIALSSNATPALVCLLRFAIASLVFPIIFYKKIKGIKPKDLIYGAIVGVVMAGGFLLQTTGQLHTTPGNSALFTAVYVVLVPFMWWAVEKVKPTLKVFLGALMCLGGVFIISFTDGFNLSLNLGDFLTLLSAVFYAAHMIAVSKSLKHMNSFQVVFLQFIFCAFTLLVYYLIADLPTQQPINFNTLWLPILVLALVNSLAAYTMITYAQQYVSPNKVSIILCLESVFGTIFSIIIGWDKISLHLVIGGLLIVASAVLVEVKFGKSKKSPIPTLEIDNIVETDSKQALVECKVEDEKDIVPLNNDKPLPPL